MGIPGYVNFIAPGVVGIAGYLGGRRHASGGGDLENLHLFRHCDFLVSNCTASVISCRISLEDNLNPKYESITENAKIPGRTSNAGLLAFAIKQVTTMPSSIDAPSSRCTSCITRVVFCNLQHMVSSVPEAISRNVTRTWEGETN